MQGSGLSVWVRRLGRWERWGWWSAMVCLVWLAGCATPLRSGDYQCEPDDAGGCPSGWLCQCRGAACEWRCYSSEGAFCGDGELAAGEECDGVAGTEEGGLCESGFPYCRVDCKLACTQCGDGNLEATPAKKREECDDGNLIDGDGCSATCTLARCGDGFIDGALFETCDLGEANSDVPDAPCRRDCHLRRCGDGIVDALAGERCDDGNLDPADDCTPDCKSDVRCGNGYVDFLVGEMCDDGNALSHDGCSSNCLAEAPTWKPLLPQGGAPQDRENHALVYDAARGRVVLFGGRNLLRDPITYFGDTSEWDGQRWSYSSAIGPSPRYLHSMVYDAGQRKVLLFGGGGFGMSDGATWEWNGVRWEQVASSPMSPSSDGPMAYDALRRRVILFGGGKTWEWDGSRRLWHNVTPATRGPIAVGATAMVFEPRLGRVVLFTGGGPQDVWQWNGEGGSWEPLASSAGPPFVAQAMMAYDSHRQRVVMVQDVNAIWEWDGLNGSWALRSPVSPMPEPRVGFAVVFDSTRGRTLLFSGRGFADLWKWDGATWSSVDMPFSQGPASDGQLVHDSARGRTLLVTPGNATTIWAWASQAWTEISSNSPSAPPSSRVVYDKVRRRVVMHNGGSRATWEWNGLAWSSVTSSPTTLLSSVAIYHQAERRMLVFGGHSNLDSYSWDGVIWRPASLLSMPRIAPALTYDSARARVVLFGGFDGGRQRDETWELMSNRWTRMSPSVIPPSTPGEMSFDPLRRRTVLLANGKTWEWSGENWADVTPASAAPSSVFSMVYDPLEAATLAVTAGALWAFQYRHPLARDETCRFGFDTDGDSLIGCADPDCWGYCTPLCEPGQTCDPAAERCGDGVCNAALESCRLCPTDCGACTPRCGDFLCDASESRTSCPGDCL